VTFFISNKYYFELTLSPSNYTVKQIDYKNAILLMLLKKIKIYIIFVLLFESLKKISIICYNMKVKNIYYLYL